MKFDEIIIDIPAYTVSEEEAPHIDMNREYFAVTTHEFVIYAKDKKCWYCLRTGLIIPGNISDIIDENGEMWLHSTGKPMTHGKWGTASNIDDILDLYNSGKYVEWMMNS